MQAASPTPGPRLRAPSWSAASSSTQAGGSRERHHSYSQVPQSHEPSLPPLPEDPHHQQQQQQQQLRRRQWSYRLVWAGLSALVMLGVYAWHNGRTPRQERAALAAAKAEQLRRARAAVEEVAAAAEGQRTLVLYNVHHDESPLDGLHRENLAFFLEVAVNSAEEAPLADYLFLVPPLPAHPPPPLGASSFAAAAAASVARRRVREERKGLMGRRRGKAIRRRWPSIGEGEGKAGGAEEEEEEEQEPYTLPAFPKAANVRVVQRPAHCLGASGLADLLREQGQAHEAQEGQQLPSIGGGEGADAPAGAATTPGAWRLDLDAYAHFVLLDSSVRGPFLPRYLHRGRRGSLEEAAGADPWSTPQTRRPWTAVLTDKLGGPRDVALVGPTVSCEREMHVQAPVWATDRDGLRLLLEAGVLDCARERGEAFWEGYELAATRAVMDAGRSVDCLMLRYQGVDLRRVRDEGLACTGGDNPSLPFRNDGLPVNPLEVVFVVARPHLLASDPLLRRYTDYALGRVPLAANEYLSPRVQAAVQARKARLARAARECGAELDAVHLLARCPECAPPPGQDLLEKFLRDHWAQGYDYRFHLKPLGRGGGGKWGGGIGIGVGGGAPRLPHPHCASFAEYNAPDLSA